MDTVSGAEVPEPEIEVPEPEIVVTSAMIEAGVFAWNEYWDQERSNDSNDNSIEWVYRAMERARRAERRR